VSVVPLRVAAGDPGERGGDLVQRVFVEPDEHEAPFRAGCCVRLTFHRLQMEDGAMIRGLGSAVIDGIETRLQ
jgi:hypothetical protein